jgi:hypothetical protein
LFYSNSTRLQLLLILQQRQQQQQRRWFELRIFGLFNSDFNLRIFIDLELRIFGNSDIELRFVGIDFNLRFFGIGCEKRGETESDAGAESSFLENFFKLKRNNHNNGSSHIHNKHS